MPIEQPQQTKSILPLKNMDQGGGEPEYLIIKMLFTQDYLAKDRLNTNLYLLCPLTAAQIISRPKQPAPSVSSSSYLIFPIAETHVNNTLSAFDVYPLGRKLIWMGDVALSSKSEVYCVSLIYNFLRNIMRPLQDMLIRNVLLIENLWCKETDIFLIVRSKQTEQETILSCESAIGQKKSQVLIREGGLLLWQVFFKRHSSVFQKSFIRELIKSMVQGQMSVQELMNVMEDKMARWKFICARKIQDGQTQNRKYSLPVKNMFGIIKRRSITNNTQDSQLALPLGFRRSHKIDRKYPTISIFDEVPKKTSRYNHYSQLDSPQLGRRMVLKRTINVNSEAKTSLNTLDTFTQQLSRFRAMRPSVHVSLTPQDYCPRERMKTKMEKLKQSSKEKALKCFHDSIQKQEEGMSKEKTIEEERGLFERAEMLERKRMLRKLVGSKAHHPVVLKPQGVIVNEYLQEEESQINANSQVSARNFPSNTSPKRPLRIQANFEMNVVISPAKPVHTSPPLSEKYLVQQKPQGSLDKQKQPLKQLEVSVQEKMDLPRVQICGLEAQAFMKVPEGKALKNSFPPETILRNLLAQVPSSDLDSIPQVHPSGSVSTKNVSPPKPVIPTPHSKKVIDVSRKPIPPIADQDQLQEIILPIASKITHPSNRHPTLHPKPETKSQAIKQQTVKQQTVKQQTGSEGSQEMVNRPRRETTQSNASSSGANQSMRKAIEQYLFLINKMGQAVAKTSKLSKQLQEGKIQWYVGIYFIYKRFYFQRLEIERCLSEGVNKLSRYPCAHHEKEFREWLPSEDRLALLDKIRKDNKNIQLSMRKMAAKMQARRLPGRILLQCPLQKRDDREGSKVATQFVVDEYDQIISSKLIREDRAEYMSDEVYVHINEMVNALYILAEIDGVIKEKTKISELCKVKRTFQELQTRVQFIFDLYEPL